MKIIVTGMGRHGKDTVCEILEEFFDLDFISSSQYSAKLLFSKLSPVYGYKTVDECFNDRHNHREEWFNFITEYNYGDMARLGKQILSEYSVYCGIRNVDELNAIKKEGIVDLIVWVDASKRLGTTEGTNSITVTEEDCDITITNNGSLQDLRDKINRVFSNFIL